MQHNLESFMCIQLSHGQEKGIHWAPSRHPLLLLVFEPRSSSWHASPAFYQSELIQALQLIEVLTIKLYGMEGGWISEYHLKRTIKGKNILFKIIIYNKVKKSSTYTL